MEDMANIGQLIGQFVYDLLTNIYQELGSGFNEGVYQNAFAIELRERGIEYLKEVNLEIFYKGQSVGSDRPDFLILGGKMQDMEIRHPIVIEMKVANALTNDNRQQLKTYFISLCQTKDSRLKDIRIGLLAKLLKSEDYSVPEKTKNPVDVEVFYFDEARGKMNLTWHSGTLTHQENLTEE